ncbi:cytochrome c biogenesis protein DipZ [Sphingomonas alba]|uniref:Cytochrome c biogenesis protein DipZ n=1 Tax=Sphingomonas alba TaxID=2908208 RepID=A0ABT0RP17_9SPHN|nr:cytochrome c biogenesis protein DipZ [Sphingomonas alba]MCL6684217.1 cytochrome c biogenesis protein DipZ [Sphingomonas alba]
MTLFLLAYLGGVLTILSPCILPVLPFVFARADRPFVKSGLPLLVGMALSFAAIATLAAVGGGWAVEANRVGRAIALILFAGFALLLIFPSLSDRAMQPLVRLGERLSGPGRKEGIGGSLLLGLATGLLWAPCAGPILGLILTGAALSGASANTVLLLLAYALGAATSLGLALLIGGRVFTAMKKSLGAGQWVRRALGVLVLAAVVVIALGLDTKLLTKVSSSQTNAIETGLAKALGMEDRMPSGGSASLSDQGPMPPFDGATGWLNSAPLDAKALKGKVVLVDFWTYSCINCIRTIPEIEALHKRYAKDGLVIVGVHTPEFAFERDPANIRKAIGDFGITYPVAIDSNYTIWRAFKNQYWPAHYLADADGRIRYHHFGEGGAAQTEAAIRTLLAEAGRNPGDGMAQEQAQGASAAASGEAATRETYVGFGRGANFASPGGFVRGKPASYAVPARLAPGQWAYGGQWTVELSRGRLNAAGGSITMRFKARDLHLVLGSPNSKPVRFRVALDGKAPGADHGMDIDAAGNGQVTDHRLYQLIRQKSGAAERTFTITFLDPGVEAYAFTFG